MASLKKYLNLIIFDYLNRRKRLLSYDRCGELICMKKYFLNYSFYCIKAANIDSIGIEGNVEPSREFKPS